MFQLLTITMTLHIISIVLLVVLFLSQILIYVFDRYDSNAPKKHPNALHINNVLAFPVRQLPAQINVDKHKYYANDVYCFQSYASPPQGVLDLRKYCPPVYNQGIYGDCTNQSTAFLIEYYCRNVLGVSFRPSRWLLNFMVQRFQSNEYNRSIVPVEMQTYGNAINTNNTGGSNVYNNIAVMMMSGMVKEEQFPFPTPKTSAAYEKTLKQLHTMFEKYHKKDITIEQLRHFIQKYNQFLHPLRIPSKALYHSAQYNRVTKCFTIDSSSIEDIRKCLHYVGPIAFDIALPFWLHAFYPHHVASVNNIECICNQLIETYPNLNQDETKFLHLFPSVIKKMYKIKQRMWSQTLLQERIEKMIQKHPKQMQEWLKEPSKVLRKPLYDRLKKMVTTLQPQCRLSDKQVRERCTCSYPHANEQKYKAILNADNNRYNKAHALFQLLDNYALHTVIEHKPQSEAIKKAIAYFKGQVVGGHSMVIVGYDDIREVFIVRNSWGRIWGDNGYFYLSYDFFKEDTFNPFRPFGRWIGQMVCVAGVKLGVD